MPLLLLAFGLAVQPSLAQNPIMDQAIADFVEAPIFLGASIGISVYELGGTQVAGHDANRTLIPASSQKVLTCATALEVFAPSHKFTTSLTYRGSIRDGVLSGDLFLKGGGDPALGSNQFGNHYEGMVDNMVAALTEQGVTTIEGGLIVDERYFDSEVLVGSTAVGDVGNYYGGGAHALSYKDNRYTITFSSENTDGGATQIVSNSPSIPGLKLSNEVLASSENADNAYVYGVPGSSWQVVRGSIPMGKEAFTIKAAIPQPGLLLAAELKGALEAAGIVVKQRTKAHSKVTNTRRLEGLEITLLQVHSPKLAAIVNHTLHKSDNSYADILLKHIGKRLNDGGGFASGVSAVQAHWEERMPSASMLWMQDGSGLSRLNGITAAQLATVCAQVDPKVMNTLKEGFKPLDKSGRIVAKSGTISRVKSYTGYFTGKGGTQYGFSVIVNNSTSSGADVKRYISIMLEAMCRG